MADNRSLEPSDFEGATLNGMRGWVEGGSGADPLFENAKVWQEEEKYLRDLASRVGDQLKQAGVAIESRSGDAMQNAMAPVVLWTEVAADNVQVQSERMTDQGEAFKRVETAIPKKGEESPVPDDNIFEEGFDTLVNGKTDAEAANQKNEALRQEAVTAFNGYDSTSQSNVAASAVFTPPPPGGMDTTVASGPQQQVGSMQGMDSASSGHAAGTQSSWASHSVSGGGNTGGNTPGGSGTTPSGTNPSHYQPGQGSPGYQPGQNVPPGQRGPGQAGPGMGGLAAGGAGGAGRGAGGAGGAGRGAGGAGGAGRGAGGAGGAGRGASGASGPGAGGRAGIGGQGGSGSGSGSGPGGSNAAGGRGGAGAPGGAGGAGKGKGQPGEGDEEHESPDYLKGDYGFFDDEMPKVAPPVFGDWEQR